MAQKTAKKVLKHHVLLATIITAGLIFVILCIIVVVLRLSTINKTDNSSHAAQGQVDSSTDENRAIAAALIIDSVDIYKARTRQYPSTDSAKFVSQIGSLNDIKLNSSIADGLTDNPALPHYSNPDAMRLHACENTDSGTVTGIEIYYYQTRKTRIESTGSGCSGNQETSHLADVCKEFTRIAKIDDGGICEVRAALDN